MQNLETQNLVLPKPALETEGCLQELFEFQADLHPESVALICGTRQWSYLELERLTNRLARYLRAQGVGPGQFVAIYLERSALPIISLLACLKAGAAYVPLDPTYPVERIRHILEESKPVLFISEGDLAQKASEFFDGNVLDLQEAAPWLESHSTERLTLEETGATPRDLCYVIYTSGTTGRPKGVMAEHRNTYRFVRSFNQICGTGSQDRVYQGFSLGFDGSVEEIWMAFSNGSALITGVRDTPRFGAELGRFLNESGITYFSTVPTLLSTLSEVPDSLKTLVVSGEACPLELINRWVRSGIKMFNVYGPTEATVNTTAYECVPNRPVKIGFALRGYDLHILDPQMRPVAQGEKGELFISGPTLSRGYLNQPELTAKNFVTAPDGSTRLYRTGDLVAAAESGELDFFGRIDSQVKIRGYRVELAEIESILLEDLQIRSACVKLFEKDGLQELAAYVTLESENQDLDRDELLSRLESRLPPYMIPGFLEILDSFTLQDLMLSSGKVDRKRLPDPTHPWVRSRGKVIAPSNQLEAKVAQAWSAVLGVGEISIDDDFFLDLGGHSLVAAKLVTQLREVIGRRVTVRDIYGFQTVRKLAAHIEKLPQEIDSRNTVQNRAQASIWIGLAQLLSMYVMYGLVAIPASLVFVLATKWVLGSLSIGALIGLSLLIAVATLPVSLLLGICAKWAIIGRFKAGSYPLWGTYYFRYWWVTRFQSLTGAGILAGTPLMPFYLRLMGAKVGSNCDLDTAMFAAWDLISIGDDSAIGADTQVMGSRIENGMLHLGRVDIGSRCFIGLHSALGLHVKMEDDSRLDDQSLLPDFDTIASGEGRRGSPGQPATVIVSEPALGSENRRHPILFGALHLLASELLGLLFLIPSIPFLAYWYYAFASRGAAFGAISLVLSVPVGFVTYLLSFTAIKRMVCLKAEPGVYRVESLFYLRKWLSDGMMRMSRGVFLPLYTTIYLPAWLRLMGAKIGARAELSTVWNFCPELIDVGAESFFADGSIIGGKRFYRGSFQIGINKIGRRTFVGNSAVLPVGVGLGDGCLLGVQSIPPAGSSCTKDGTEWLGSPAFALPHRLKVGNFDDSVTFRPTPKLYLQRSIIDGLRILIPGYIALVLGVTSVFVSYYIYSKVSFLALILSSPVIAFVMSLMAALMTIAIKWAVMGKFKPEIVPLWSMYVWLNEMVNGIYESVMAPAVAPLKGTPFIAPLLRMMGCKIGKHTYIESILFSEFDLVEIGSYAALNAGAIIQTHLFEDRIMKSSSLKVGEGCTVGNMAVVLYDSEMKQNSTLGPLSLLMKGETLEAASRSYGIPSQQAPDSLLGQSLGLHGLAPRGMRTQVKKSMWKPAINTSGIQQGTVREIL